MRAKQRASCLACCLKKRLVGLYAKRTIGAIYQKQHRVSKQTKAIIVKAVKIATLLITYLLTLSVLYIKVL